MLLLNEDDKDTDNPGLTMLKNGQGEVCAHLCALLSTESVCIL